MKITLLLIGTLFMIMAALATPAGIGIAIYQWAFAEVGIAFALWAGFKTWIGMLALGMVVGYPCYIIGVSK